MQHLVNNRYRVVWTLAGDGVIKVYLARDDILGRDIVLKALSSPYSDDKELVGRFWREARDAAALSHPNIVSIFDQGLTEDGSYYIAMEYLSGGSLKGRMKKLGPLPDRRAATVALQVARALRFAHDNGVIHGDLKPGDVLITEAGDVKVKDFGIAKSTSSKTDAVDTRRSDPYLAPERADGEKATREGDLYSLGVILHEMLTGEPPRDDDSITGSPNRSTNGEGSGGAVSSIVATLTSQNPDNRYADSDQLVEDLGRASAGIETGNVGTGTRLQPVSQESSVPRRSELRRGGGRRQPLLLALSLLAVLLVAGLAWAGFSFLQTSSQEQSKSPGSRPESKPVMLKVPDLGGMTLEAARRKVGEDFEIVRDREENSNRTRGTILEYEPSNGKAEKGAEIQAVIAGGRNKVPAIEDSTLEKARKSISDAGFEPTVKEAESTADKEGLVLSQNPAIGGTAELGSEVEIVMGTGPAPAEAPAPVETPVPAEAPAPVETPVPAEAPAPAKVPAPVEAPAPAKAPAPIKVPSLYGYTPNEAAAQLQNLGLVFSGSDTAPSDEVTKGGVIAQSVAPGVSVEPGVAVGVTVSSGPKMTPVPNVVGQTLDRARQNIAGAGFSYNVLEIPNAQWPRGTVLYTDPGTGARIVPGSKVTVGYSSGPSARQPAASSRNSQGGRQVRKKPAKSP